MYISSAWNIYIFAVYPISLNRENLINHIKEVYMYTYKWLLLLYQLARYYHPGRSLIWRWCGSASLIIAWWLLCLLLWICSTVASRIIWLYSVRRSGKGVICRMETGTRPGSYTAVRQGYGSPAFKIAGDLMCTCLHHVIQQRQIYHRITWYRNVNIYTLAHCLLVCMFTCNNRYLQSFGQRIQQMCTYILVNIKW